MKIIKVLMMLLSIITFATKVANAADKKEVKTETIERKTTVEEKVVDKSIAPVTTAAAPVTKTVKEKLDGLNVTKAELEKYASDQKISLKRKEAVKKLGLSLDDYKSYLLDKINTALLPCFWCKKATEAKKDEKPTPVVTPSKTSTPTSSSPTAKTKWYAHSGRYDFLRVGLGGRLLNSYTSEQPIGFNTSTSDTGMDLEWMVELKAWHIAVEYRPGHTVDLEDKFYGSSIGKEKLITEQIIIPKFYVVDGPGWSGSLGLVIEQARVEGNLSMGGAKFKNNVTAVAYGVQLSGEYHMCPWASIRGSWEIGGPTLTNYIPGVPDQTLQGTGRVLGMIVVGY